MAPINRDAVRVLLLHDHKLLLMCIENYDISTIEGSRNQRFWCTIGGKIEPGESLPTAALREIYEETGLSSAEITLGPVVWYSEVNLVLKGVLTCLKESFIVATTNNNKVALCQPTADEQQTVKTLTWFSLAQITSCPDVIFPRELGKHLPAILAGDYPLEPVLLQT